MRQKKDNYKSARFFLIRRISITYTSEIDKKRCVYYVKSEILIRRLQILWTKLNAERHFFIFLKKVFIQNESRMTYLYVPIKNQDTEIIGFRKRLIRRK